MLGILNKIPAKLPKAWVIGILLWIAAAICMGLAALCLLINWLVGYYFFFVLLGACILSFLASIFWSLVERLTGRVTPWRVSDEQSPTTADPDRDGVA